MGWWQKQLPKKEQERITGDWSPPVHYCECGRPETVCPEVMRHYLKALIPRLLEDPLWTDPAHFPVPRDAVPWIPPPKQT